MGRAKIKRAGPRRDGKRKVYLCPMCRQEVMFCWRCTCGFMICQKCMEENAWGMTCNHVTWACPDCGNSRSY